MTNNQRLTPRQNSYLTAYVNPASPSFGNSYQSAVSAGYSDQTARNLTHLKPNWLSDSIGQVADVITPDEIMMKLTNIIDDPCEPTLIKLKALELSMRAHSMLVQVHISTNTRVEVNISMF